MGEPGKKKNVDDLIRHTAAAVDADRKRLQVRMGGAGAGVVCACGGARAGGGITLQCMSCTL